MAKARKKAQKQAVRKRKITISEKIITGVAGLVSVAFGIVGIFIETDKLSTLALIAGSVILGLAVLDFINLFRNRKNGGAFAFSLIRAGSGLLIAILTIVNCNQGMTWPLTLLSVYTIGRGILDILTALAFVTNQTERFFWIICGAIGCVLGIISLNSGGFADASTFFRIFAIYMTIAGVTSLVSLVYKTNKE